MVTPMKDREIEHLSERDHMLLRPNMYIGTVESLSHSVPIFDGELLRKKEINYSEGFYRLLDEVVDNAFDEALRCANDEVDFDEINVSIDSKNNIIEVSDSGNGFINPNDMNNSGMTNVETAVSMLRAGSNFRNDQTDVNLIGTNGIGVSAVNMLSEFFEIETINNGYCYYQRWEDFKMVKKDFKETLKSSGTTIRYKPLENIFKKIEFDYDYVFTKFLFRDFTRKNNSKLENVKFNFRWNDTPVNLDVNIIPEKSNYFKLNRFVDMYIWQAEEKSTSISFVNGSECIGFHNTYYREHINDKFFNSPLAGEFYEIALIINLPPRYVQFQEQNKNRFVITRGKMDELMPFRIRKYQLDEFKQTEVYQSIQKVIDEKIYNQEVKKIKSQKRKNKKILLSDKFFPSTKKGLCMLCEGISAASNTASGRNPKFHAIYALKGKVKNVRRLSDLSSNAEIIDMMNILNLNIEDQGESCDYQKIVIAADADVDGNAIAALLMNLFGKWFPRVIKNKKLFKLVTPLLSYQKGKERKYVYSMTEIQELDLSKLREVRYLKGLGSLDSKDWKEIYNDMNLEQITIDKKSLKYLDFIFGDDSKYRKNWLKKGE